MHLEKIDRRDQEPKEQCVAVLEAGTTAFDRLLEAMRLPADNPARNAAIADATIRATEVPLGVLEACPEVIELCRQVARIGFQASLSDAGVGSQMARAAAAGAYQNVCINLAGLTDKRKAALLARADKAWKRVLELHVTAEREILVKLRSSV